MLSLIEFPFLPVSEGHTLVETDFKTSKRKGMDNYDSYYDEVDVNDEIIAKYHVWNHMNIHPPQKTDEGWIKYDLDGVKITSGSCT